MCTHIIPAHHPRFYNVFSHQSIVFFCEETREVVTSRPLLSRDRYSALEVGGWGWQDGGDFHGDFMGIYWKM